MLPRYAQALEHAATRGFEYDYFLVARSDVTWYRPAPAVESFSRRAVTTPDVWMLTTNDQFMVAPAGPLAERLLRVSEAGEWWCFGNAYGGSPFHSADPPRRACVREPIRAALVDRLGPFSPDVAGQSQDDVADAIADDVMAHYCCTGDRGALFQSDVGHTEHLLARKICGKTGKHACGDHSKGWLNLEMARLVQTVVRSTAGADCGRLINYQGNPSIWSRGRPSFANYLTCVLAFHDCEFQHRSRAVLGPWGGSPVSEPAVQGHGPVAMARRCEWPPAALAPGRRGLARPYRLETYDGACVTVDANGASPAPTSRGRPPSFAARTRRRT